MADAELPAYYSDAIDPVTRSSREELFYIVMEARPGPAAQEYGEAGGAFVNCWVDADDLRAAQRRAVDLIRESGWRPHRLESWEIVTRDSYAEWVSGDDGGFDPRDAMTQAFIDGEVCEYFCWPADAPDADECS
jgi:hypothetical protein